MPYGLASRYLDFQIIPFTLAGKITQRTHLEYQVNIKDTSDPGLRLLRQRSTDTLFEQAVTFLRSKLNECLATHAECHHIEPLKESKYPTRLLNLKSPYRSRVFLEDTSEETKGHYFTLSHCWGGLQPVTLTRGSEQTLRGGINIRDLPKTFREAIYVCRKLDIPYLWIDSLCIFQDDLTDWHAEAASMRQVYASAVCNIAAAGAKDASVGLRFQHDSMVSDSFEISAPKQFWLPGQKQAPIEYLVCSRSSFSRDIENGPLNFRAWVLQERVLSRRTMHFTASGVYWECLSNIANVMYPERLPDWIYREEEIQTIKLLLLQGNDTNNSHVTQAWKNKVYDAWNQLCYMYSRMGMSVESDKLVAIHGIAQKLSQINGDKLVCGLWEQRLLPQLLWCSVQIPNLATSFPLHWRAPSWSWASNNNIFLHAAHLSCGYGQAKAIVEKIEVDAYVSGQLKDASLTLRGKVVEAKLDLQTEVKNSVRSVTTAHLHCGDDAMKVCAPFFDLTADDSDSMTFHEQVLCIGVYEDRCGRNAEEDFHPTWELGVLILRQCHLDPPKYQRIGIFLLSGEDLAFYTSHESQEERSITII
ncbi:HET-domain-containing protein [Cucurbitaria berberidis CBS 394.84]|uniref:HET-domain-containing protein n=1 Tax=Cucurbitaria berberidis CBS 394.84 TaxID=1168544 RepID=A0A9P4G6S2_9PLEO|nr:HET-domain-containing protein [Cucurbitaria berberidis CBS 394.84]KAF1840077.1 HET-domain-containing protein [Cucurbitaria berberidis CBS 394.84]